MVPNAASPISLCCDSDGAIAQTKEPRSHQKSKYVLRKFHFIREIVDRGDVEVCEISTDDNVADPLTKPLSQKKHERHLAEIGIKTIIE